jgi:AraC-like DNA-binding protein
MSETGLAEPLNRAGMQITRRGTMVEVPWSNGAEGTSVGSVAWAGHNMGLFVLDWTDSNPIELETLARTDVIVCTTVLNQDEARTDYAVGDNRYDAKGADMSVVFVPKHERLVQSVAKVSPGLKAVTVVFDIMSMMEARGISPTTLPKSLQGVVRRREIAMETLHPGHFGEIARGVAARRAMLPAFSSVYYEGKAFELVSALLSGLARRDAVRAGDMVLHPRILDRLGEVKQFIDRAPHRSLDVDALARVAAMNRTKLRCAFKQVYGVTLSAYRAALMLQRADVALKQAGASVKQVARHAGYATTSSFIVAYKRRYGICPGRVVRD